MADGQIPTQSVTVLRALIPVDLDLTAAERKLDAFEERLSDIEDRLKSLGATAAMPQPQEDRTRGGMQPIPNGVPGEGRMIEKLPMPAVGEGSQNQLEYALGRFKSYDIQPRDLVDMLSQEDSRLVSQLLSQINEKMDTILVKLGDE